MQISLASYTPNKEIQLLFDDAFFLETRIITELKNWKFEKSSPYCDKSMILGLRLDLLFSSRYKVNDVISFDLSFLAHRGQTVKIDKIQIIFIKKRY